MSSSNYMCYLSKKLIDESIRKMFFEIRLFYKIYKSLLNRVKIKRLTRYTTHKQLKKQFIKKFDTTWLENVFRFAISTIKLKKKFEKILIFSRCKFHIFCVWKLDLYKYSNTFVQLIVEKKFRELHEINIFDRRFAQYNRKYIVDFYDDFHKRKEFVDQFVNMYFETHYFSII